MHSAKPESAALPHRGSAGQTQRCHMNAKRVGTLDYVPTG